jgi:hypothetical protein
MTQVAQPSPLKIRTTAGGLILLTLVIFAGCDSNPAAPSPSTTSPAWVTALIRQLEAQPPANPQAFLARYDYKGQDVYFLPKRCCDVMSDVYQADGTVMCHPDGGVTGSGDGRCADFFIERKNESIIWRDLRS